MDGPESQLGELCRPFIPIVGGNKLPLYISQAPRTKSCSVLETWQTFVAIPLMSEDQLRPRTRPWTRRNASITSLEARKRGRTAAMPSLNLQYLSSGTGRNVHLEYQEPSDHQTPHGRTHCRICSAVEQRHKDSFANANSAESTCLPRWCSDVSSSFFIQALRR